MSDQHTVTEFSRVNTSIDGSDRDESTDSSDQPLYRSGGPNHDSSGMYDFTPPTRILSAQEELAEEEIEKGFYQPKELDVRVVSAPAVKLPSQLKAFVYDRGDVRLFPSPSIDSSGKLSKILHTLLRLTIHAQKTYTLIQLLPPPTCTPNQC